MTSMNILLSACIAIALTCAAFGQASPPASKVDEYIHNEMEKRHVPGLAVAVVKDGKVLLAKGYGMASVELQAPVKPETLFQTASIGKQFTATAVMMLVEQGKINLNEKINKYLGDVPASWNDITVRHLLNHTSGLGGYPDNFDFRRDYTEDELLKIVQAQPLAFKPGEKWQYSNAGYMTLGVVIRKVSGKFYGEYLQENIFKPAGMTTAMMINEL